MGNPAALKTQKKYNQLPAKYTLIATLYSKDYSRHTTKNTNDKAYELRTKL